MSDTERVDVELGGYESHEVSLDWDADNPEREPFYIHLEADGDGDVDIFVDYDIDGEQMGQREIEGCDGVDVLVYPMTLSATLIIVGTERGETADVSGFVRPGGDLVAAQS